MHPRMRPWPRFRRHPKRRRRTPISRRQASFLRFTFQREFSHHRPSRAKRGFRSGRSRVAFGSLGISGRGRHRAPCPETNRAAASCRGFAVEFRGPSGRPAFSGPEIDHRVSVARSSPQTRAARPRKHQTPPRHVLSFIPLVPPSPCHPAPLDRSASRSTRPHAARTAEGRVRGYLPRGELARLSRRARIHRSRATARGVEYLARDADQAASLGRPGSCSPGEATTGASFGPRPRRGGEARALGQQCVFQLRCFTVSTKPLHRCRSPHPLARREALYPVLSLSLRSQGEGRNPSCPFPLRRRRAPFVCASSRFPA